MVDAAVSSQLLDRLPSARPRWSDGVAMVDAAVSSQLLDCQPSVRPRWSDGDAMVDASIRYVSSTVDCGSDSREIAPKRRRG